MGKVHRDLTGDLTFQDFKKMAEDEELNEYEKIGFPELYRKGYAKQIWNDIVRKIPTLNKKHKTLVDIGSGYSDLTRLEIKYCRIKGDKLFLIDSEEMLSKVPPEDFLTKVNCEFPYCPDLLDKLRRKADAIIVYSVLHHAYVNRNIFNFIDEAVKMLNEGGIMLIGDIPNSSKRRRFFSTPRGIDFHKKFTGTDTLPDVDKMEKGRSLIDDSVIFSITGRYRGKGFETYLLPQPAKLPFSNRRDDILIIRT